VPRINRRQQRRTNASLHLGSGWVRLFLAISSIFAFSLSTAIAYADTFDFPASDFKIMDAHGTQVIGHGHYEVSRGSNGYATAFGEDRFNDGEYDFERDKLELRSDDQVPRMVTFEHTFYNANGTLQRVNRANLETGTTSCIQYENGQPVAHNAVLQFPPDTYAGAAIVIPLKVDLLSGRKNEIVLHDFNCIPGPKILKVKANLQPPSEWAHFQGKVVRVDIKPDFGWLNLVAALLVPQIHAWFSPSDGWRFVGGKFTRFYKGPEIVLALVSKPEHRATNPNHRTGQAAAPSKPADKSSLRKRELVREARCGSEQIARESSSNNASDRR
jgi:hypothetical protein